MIESNRAEGTTKTRAAHLRADDALLFVIDLQEKLLPHIWEHGRVLQRAILLVRAARRLGIPLLCTEQYTRGLGATVPPLIEALNEPLPSAPAVARPLEKIAFGCLDDAAIMQAAEASGRKQIILCGIETHVCVMQTALRALDRGWQVFLARDACGSRRPSDAEIAHARLSQAGAIPASVEMLVMEALGKAEGEKFKAILPLLKE